MNIKDWVATVFYSLLILVTLVFAYNYAFIDWDEVAESFEGVAENMESFMDCKIDYYDFHYSGNCLDKEIIFDFMRNESLGGSG